MKLSRFPPPQSSARIAAALELYFRRLDRVHPSPPRRFSWQVGDTHRRFH